MKILKFTVVAFVLIFSAPSAFSNTTPLTIPDIEKTVKAIPEKYSSALKLYHEGEYTKSLKALPKITREATREDKYYKTLLESIAQFSLGKTDPAVKNAKKALKIRSSSSDALLLLGLIEKHNNNLENALQYLQESSWFNRFQIFSSGHAFLTEAEILFTPRSEETADQSLPVVQKLIAANPTFGSGYTLLGQIQREKKNRSAALQAFRKAATLNPKDSVAGFELVTLILEERSLFQNKNELREAKTICENHLKDLDEEKKSESKFFAPYIRSLIRVKDFKKAEEEIQLAKKLNANSPEFQRIEQQFQMEQSLEKKVSENKEEA